MRMSLLPRIRSFLPALHKASKTGTLSRRRLQLCSPDRPAVNLKDRRVRRHSEQPGSILSGSILSCYMDASTRSAVFVVVPSVQRHLLHNQVMC